MFPNGVCISCPRASFGEVGARIGFLAIWQELANENWTLCRRGVRQFGNIVPGVYA